jgi:bacterioferritin (cytochrome b1)
MVCTRKIPGNVGDEARLWRDRAEEAIERAERMRDPIARRIMLDIAAGYEAMAERLEQQSAT